MSHNFLFPFYHSPAITATCSIIEERKKGTKRCPSPTSSIRCRDCDFYTGMIPELSSEEEDRLSRVLPHCEQNDEEDEIEERIGLTGKKTCPHIKMERKSGNDINT